MRTALIALVILTANLAACSSKSADASADSKGSAAPGGDKKGAAKASSVDVTIAPLGLKGTAAGEENKPLVTDAGETQMLTFSQFSVQVRAASEMTPKEPKDVEEDSKAYDKSRNFKSEKLSDGWMTMYEHTGGAGDFYNLTVLRNIGGKAYLCTTGADNDAMRKKALDFCKTLAKS